jgi:hypothetical protein
MTIRCSGINDNPKQVMTFVQTNTWHTHPLSEP